MTPVGKDSSPIADWVLALSGTLSIFLSLKATGETSMEDAGVDFFFAFFLASVCVVAWLVSVPKEKKTS